MQKLIGWPPKLKIDQATASTTPIVELLQPGIIDKYDGTDPKTLPLDQQKDCQTPKRISHPERFTAAKVLLGG